MKRNNNKGVKSRRTEEYVKKKVNLHNAVSSCFQFDQYIEIERTSNINMKLDQ